jgi:hypothetical protein
VFLAATSVSTAVTATAFASISDPSLTAITPALLTIASAVLLIPPRSGPFAIRRRFSRWFCAFACAAHLLIPFGHSGAA